MKDKTSLRRETAENTITPQIYYKLFINLGNPNCQELGFLIH